ncbi:MAG: 4-hydroxy-tetrahydrodipicolinate reductase [Desulfobia sp.]
MTTRVIVSGAAGRMGRRICDIVNRNPRLELSGALEHQDNAAIGSDIGETGGFGKTGVTVSSDLSSIIDHGDVIIDFTAPEATMKIAREAAIRNKSMVIGTTGLSGENLKELQNLAGNMAIVQAPNMAVGVNLLFKLTRKVASILGDNYDIEIIESHHRLKKDAPSGTALKLGEMAAEGVNRDFNKIGVFERHGIIGQRTNEEIGIQAIRAGDIIGEHTVYFAGPGERLELTHKAQSRDNFAGGAAVAAAWLADKENGMYTMFDVLGLADL